MNAILLATSQLTHETITVTIISLIILVTSIVLLVKKYKSMPNGEIELDNFLKDIQSIVKKRIIEFIENFDFSTIKEDYINLQATLIENIYDDIYDLVEEELEAIYGNDEAELIYKAIKKIITREKIESYVNTIYSADDIQDKLADLFNIALADQNKKIEEEDAELNAENEKECIQDIENAEKEVDDSNSTVPVLDPMKLNGVDNGEEVIIPPSEEESDVVDVDTVEVIEESEVDFDEEGVEAPDGNL